MIQTAGAVQVEADFFTDVQGHFSAPYAAALYSKCSVDGFKDADGKLLHQFKPDAAITRAELVAMILKCDDKAHVESGSKFFRDVEAKAWFADAVSRAAVRGWVKGYDDGTFRPMAAVNRAEALKMIMLAAAISMEAPTQAVGFSDVAITDWFYEYVVFATAKGYVQGRGAGKFVPAGTLTRGEAAKLLALFFGLAEKQDEPESPATPSMPPVTAQDEGTTFMGCPVFPADNPWNLDISTAPVHAKSDAYIASILKGKEKLHADFGSNPDYGIPYVVVDNGTTKSSITAEYADETDAGPYPIPANPPIEAGGDRHMIMFHKDECKLYELYAADNSGGSWMVGSGAIFDLMSNVLRPDYWTSADAAGLPIFPGLARYDEVKSGKITHALRFTVSKTQKGFIHPATHFASSSTDANLPPMGLRLRLKADFDTSTFTGDSRVILEALKTYGMIVADNGSDWFISGATDPRWDDEDLNQLKTVPGSAFEAVETGPIIK